MRRPPSPARRRWLALAACLAVAAVGPASAGAVTAARAPARALLSSCPNADLAPTTANVALARAATSCLLNRERAAHGMRPLVVSAALLRVAQTHSRDMVARHYFQHDTLHGLGVIARLLSSGYARGSQRYELGEALGYNYDDKVTPARMILQLLSSPLHRAKLLGARFENVGIGIVAAPPFLFAGHGGATYTFDVGLRS